MYQGKRVDKQSDPSASAVMAQLEKDQRRKKRRRWPFVLLCTLLFLAGLYLTFISANIPFIKNLRTLYIETAMSTMSHQWLATYFIPRPVIDQVMAEAEEKLLENRVESSTIADPDHPAVSALPSQEIAAEDTSRRDALAAFYALFPEIDVTTVPDSLLEEDLDSLQVKDISGLGVKTLAGDTVWAIDVPNRLFICEVSGDGYVGKLALIRDSGQVMLAVNKKSGSGTTVNQLCVDNGAVLGINASGFDDPEGHGNGADPTGLVLSRGTVYHRAGGDPRFQIAGYDKDDNFMVGYGLDVDRLRDAMQFYPILILDGEKHVDGSYGMGIHPRSCIGQTAGGATLMLIIDGRQPGYSVGATLSECADILLRYGCWTAMNMDGGSSASMTYMGEMITKSSSPAAQGRRVPDAWIVRSAEPS